MRAKSLPFIPSQPKTLTVHKTWYKVNINNLEFDIYQRGKPQYYVDIPSGNNTMGVVYQGYFVPLFTSHIGWFKDMREYIRKIECFNGNLITELDKKLMQCASDSVKSK